MNPRKAFLFLAVLYWLGAALELGGGTVFAVRQGWVGLGPIAIAPGPVSVLIVEESGEREKLTPGQKQILFAHSPGSFIEWIKTHGEKDPAGAYRIVDKDDPLGQDELKWQAAFNLVVSRDSDGKVKLLVPSLPWLVVLRGDKVLASEAMPSDAADTMKLLKRYGRE